MQQKIKLNYLNAQLNVGLVSWREVYLLHPEQKELKPEVDGGRLVYRAKGSSKRYSYNQIKKGLIKTNRIITQEIPHFLTVPHSSPRK